MSGYPAIANHCAIWLVVMCKLYSQLAKLTKFDYKACKLQPEHVSGAGSPSGATKGGGGWRGLEHPPEQNWGVLQFVQIRRLFLEGVEG
jgi:hypothetical protein